LTNPVGQFDIQAGGFEIEGTVFNGELALFIDSNSEATESSLQDTYVVNTIVNDAWNYGYLMSSGSLSLSGNSTTITNLIDTDS